MFIRGTIVSATLYCIALPAYSQATANAVASASDAFGFRSGDDAVGIYDEGSTRGFSLESAGNYRINGSYFVRNSGVSSFFLESTTVRIGYSTLGSIAPPPSGVVEYRLRDPVQGESSTLTVGVDAYTQPYADLLLKHHASDSQSSFALGVGAVPNIHDLQGGRGGGSLLVGGAARLTTEVGTFRGFLGEYEYERPAQFRVASDPNTLPPTLQRGRFLSQDWAMELGQRRIAGALFDTETHDGPGFGSTVVFSQEDPSRSYLQIFNDLSADSAHAFVIATPHQRSTAWSTDQRVYWERASRRWNDRVDLSVRGRRSRASYGGSEYVDLGRVTFGMRPIDVSPPVLDDSAPQLGDSVDQWGAGLTYRAELPGRLRINTGVLNTRYEKRLTDLDGVALESTNAPWLYNANAAWRFASSWELYAGSARGLEEAGVAPASATNRYQVLEAALVTQQEIGLKHQRDNGPNFYVGSFSITKPYNGIDPVDGSYHPIGLVRHRGVEASFSGELAPGLKVVAGGVLLSPKLLLDGQSANLFGDQPAGVPKFRAIANAVYALAQLPGFSVDLATTYLGKRAATAVRGLDGSQLMVDEKLTFDIGCRYLFRLGNTNVAARAQVLNLTNQFSWEPTGAETMNYSPPRRFRVLLTVDF